MRIDLLLLKTFTYLCKRLKNKSEKVKFAPLCPKHAGGNFS